MISSSIFSAIVEGGGGWDGGILLVRSAAITPLLFLAWKLMRKMLQHERQPSLCRFVSLYCKESVVVVEDEVYYVVDTWTDPLFA